MNSGADSDEREKDELIAKLQEELDNTIQENLRMKEQVCELENVTSELEKTNREGFEQYDALHKEFEKVKKEKIKQEKDYEMKLTACNEELVKSYSKVDKIVKENVKLLEEKRVLQGIHKVNTDLHEKLKKTEDKLKEKSGHRAEEVSREEEEKEEDEDEVEEETDEEIEVVEHFLKQMRNRSSRTNPTSEAENPKPQPPPKSNTKSTRYPCKKCDYIAGNENALKDHM